MANKKQAVKMSKEEMFRDMIIKFFDDEDLIIDSFEKHGNKVIMVTRETRNSEPEVNEYDSFRDAFDCWSESLINSFENLCDEDDDEFCNFTKDEIKLLRAYIAE